jgi:lambda repressor-like predicted transcriptional regulator
MNKIDLALKQKAIALRMVGHSFASIASATGISVSTLQTIFKTENLPKGSATAALVAKANQDLLSDKTLTDLVKRELKSLIRSEIAIANSLIDEASITLEQLKTFNAPTRAKSLSSLANAINVASQIARRALIGGDVESTEFPKLFVLSMTDEEIDAIRKSNGDE